MRYVRTIDVEQKRNRG